MEKITILFQGDSITDGSRSRDFEDLYLGAGYPTLIAARLGAAEPGRYRFLNRGCSGNRTCDLYARWKTDCLNLRPDVLSILIGVNDVWRDIDSAAGISAASYETLYALMLREFREALPEGKLLLLEPFVLPGSATTPHWETFSREVRLRAEAVRRLAERFGAVFVPLQ